MPLRVDGPSTALGGLLRWAGGLDAVDVTTRLPLLMMLLSLSVTGMHWPLMTPLQLLAIAGLLLPPLHRSPMLWAAVAVLVGTKTVLDWWTQDNHLFLFTAWCLALALALRLPAPGPALATSARLLIGLGFAFATLWKGLLSPDFLDGSYFHYTFLTDSRFGDVAVLLGGMTEEALRANYQALAELGREGVDVVTLEDTPRLVVWARVVTAWTLFIEGAAAVAFLWPLGRGPSRARHACLLVFAYTTYLVAHVTTFAWTLLILGLAQVEPEARRTRLLYLGACFVVYVYGTVPLLGFARSWLGV